MVVRTTATVANLTAVEARTTATEVVYNSGSHYGGSYNGGGKSHYGNGGGSHYGNGGGSVH